jgi:hypothetical protein
VLSAHVSEVSEVSAVIGTVNVRMLVPGAGVFFDAAAVGEVAVAEPEVAAVKGQAEDVAGLGDLADDGPLVFSSFRLNCSAHHSPRPAQARWWVMSPPASCGFGLIDPSVRSLPLLIWQW